MANKKRKASQKRKSVGQDREEKFNIMVRNDKQKYLKMSIQEKRRIFEQEKGQTAPKWYGPKEIPTWSKVAPKKPSQKRIYPVDETVNSKVSLIIGDITHLIIDGIVNAANELLLGGGGIDRAIHDAAGPLLLNECRTLGGTATGTAKTTAGYNIPAKYIVHAVGPNINAEEDKALLRQAYHNSLLEMEKYKMVTLALPCISVGIFGYPKKEAAQVALSEVREFLENNDYGRYVVERIIFCTFSKEDKAVYEEVMPAYFPTSAPERAGRQSAKRKGNSQTVNSKRPCSARRGRR